MSRGWLVLVALLIGATVVAAEKILFTLLTGRPLSLTSDVALVNALFAAIPFLVLAVSRRTGRLPWLVGVAVTAALWGWVLYEGVSYQWNPDGTGANIGLGLIMLASPLFITAIVLTVDALKRRRSARA